jgi:hypothetical protein
MRSKKINLGFVVIDTKTGEHLSAIFKRREPAREIAKSLHASGINNVGVHTLEAYVHDGWKRGDSLDGYVEPSLLAKIQ